MMPIKNPPFYVMEAWPIVNNTQGGPEHDVEQRVLDPMKKPIPRLYVAGEISSIYGHLIWKLETSRVLCRRQDCRSKRGCGKGLGINGELSGALTVFRAPIASERHEYL